MFCFGDDMSPFAVKTPDTWHLQFHLARCDRTKLDRTTLVRVCIRVSTRPTAPGAQTPRNGEFGRTQTKFGSICSQKWCFETFLMGERKRKIPKWSRTATHSEPMLQQCHFHNFLQKWSSMVSGWLQIDGLRSTIAVFARFSVKDRVCPPKHGAFCWIDVSCPQESRV